MNGHHDPNEAVKWEKKEKKQKTQEVNFKQTQWVMIKSKLSAG